ncbi:hypothetical protein T11_18518 [Trichinella zimbabwensis]|uniref:Uncharacterized protein n=1 Tax=Trichinella zimbabwensis TaxID=268475 RepID=A0A0V1I188_9BILA|nr:hypothetical protein T11_18518 [Trichinella zimbabwensis]
MQNNAPGEDRTHNLRISLTDQALLYKYDALTDCATGAAIEPVNSFDEAASIAVCNRTTTKKDNGRQMLMLDLHQAIT